MASCKTFLSQTAFLEPNSRSQDETFGGHSQHLSGSESSSQFAATVFSNETANWQHPPSFYCPISQQCMHDPVVLSDGHSYERRYIERWLEGHNTSPVSGVRLPQLAIFANHALRNAIEEYFLQVFSVHRRAIRKTMENTEGACQTALLRTIDGLMQCSLLLGADLSTECMLRQMMDEAKQLLGADVASVFLVDGKAQELVSNVNSTTGVLRIPISSGIAGHVATTGESLIINNVYEDTRFNQAMDKKHGYKTRNMICAPLKAKKGNVIGVVQIINKVRPGTMTSTASKNTCLSSCLPGDSSEELSFSADDLNFLQVFATQAAMAVATSTFESPAMPPKVSENVVGPSDLIVKPSLQTPEAQVEASSLGEPILQLPHAHKTWEPPEAVQNMLTFSFQNWELDTLTLAAATGDKPLSTLGTYLFDELGLIDHFSLDRAKLGAFLLEVERGYEATTDSTAPYHNRAHAASVLHNMHALLLHCDLAKVAAKTFQSSAKEALADGSGRLETMACLLAAAVHDYEHLGLNNDFLVKTSHERAVRFNDQHVNENHHAAAAFALLNRPELNFLYAFPSKAFERLRGLVIELVLGTDMAKGGLIVKSFEEVLATSADRGCFEPNTARDGVLLLQVGMKCSDLGHLTLPWDLHLRWVRRLEAEFFAQGDKEQEAGLPISFLMDRGKPGASETQVGFFDFVVLPLFRLLCRAAPDASPLLAAVEANYVAWGAPVSASYA